MLSREDFQQLLEHIRTKDAPLQLSDNKYLFVQVPTAHAKIIYSSGHQSRDHLGIFDFQKGLNPIALLTEDDVFYYDDQFFGEHFDFQNTVSFSQAETEILQQVKDIYLPTIKNNLPEINLLDPQKKYYTTCARRDLFYQKPRFHFSTEAALCRKENYPAILGKQLTIKEVFDEGVALWGFERIADDLKRKELYQNLYEHPELCMKPWELDMYAAIRELKEQGATSFSIHQYRTPENLEDERVYSQRYDIVDFINIWASNGFRPDKIAFLSYKGNIVYDARPNREQRLQELEEQRASLQNALTL